MIDGKRLRISEYKQLLRAKKLADCGGVGGGGGVTAAGARAASAGSRHHQLWRDAAKAGALTLSPGSSRGHYHDDTYGNLPSLVGKVVQSVVSVRLFSNQLTFILDLCMHMGQYRSSPKN